MDIEGATPMDIETSQPKKDPYEQLQVPQKTSERAALSTSNNYSTAQVASELAANVASGAIDIATYGPLIDTSLEIGGAVLEGLGEIISAIGDGV